MRWNEISEARLPLRRGEIPKARGSYGAFIITMHPADFLKLTTIDSSNIKTIMNRPFPDTPEQYYDSTLKDYGKFEMPFLKVEFPSGKIFGHEGRHRSAMILKAGGDRIPVIIYPYSEEAYRGVIKFYDNEGYRQERSSDDDYPTREQAKEEVRKKYHDIPEEDIIKISADWAGHNTLKGEPTRSDGWDKAAWKISDFPHQLIGQFTPVVVTDFKVGLVKGYRHFRR